MKRTAAQERIAAMQREMLERTGMSLSQMHVRAMEISARATCPLPRKTRAVKKKLQS